MAARTDKKSGLQLRLEKLAKYAKESLDSKRVNEVVISCPSIPIASSIRELLDFESKMSRANSHYRYTVQASASLDGISYEGYNLVIRRKK